MRRYFITSFLKCKDLFMYTIFGISGALLTCLFVYSFYKNTRLIKTITKGLKKISVISFDLTGSAEQVGSVSKDLLNASLEQLDTLNSTISASHEINSMVLKTSDSTKDLNKNSHELKEMTVSGQSIVQEMVKASLEIKNGSENFKLEMVKSIEELSNALKVIEEIATKTKLINEIVFQTKLLSFNASVEAARAGEHGRGFSIVAEEIGKLAQVSGSSADEISKIVEKSIHMVQTALKNTHQKVDSLTTVTINQSEKGYKESKSCEHVFTQIAIKITEINEMANEISVATEEQSLGITQLDHAICKLQEVADRNRLVASQSTEHAIVFEKQTRELININEDIKILIPHFGTEVQNHQAFVWTDQLMLGVGAMDDEHKVLVSKINKLVALLDSERGKKSSPLVLEAFLELARYTTEHFAHEEKFMESMDYAQVNSHKKIHEKLLLQVSRYGEEIKMGTLDEHKLVSFLRNWLISHIMGVDMQYASEFKEGVGKQTHKKSA